MLLERLQALEEERGFFGHLLRSIDDRLSGIENQLQTGLSLEIKKDLNSINRRLNELTAGLGVTLENLTARWLKEVLAKEGHAEPFIHKRFHFNRFYDKTNPLYNYEVDCIVFDPLVIVEATSFVKRNELSKIERFAHLKRELEKDRGSDARAYFVTYGIDRTIEGQVKEIMKANNIILIDACHEVGQEAKEEEEQK